MDQQKLIDLVGRATKKDNSAMEELFKEYYTDIMYICRKYNLSEADSADIAQETFIKAFQEIRTLDNAVKFPQWLMRIATNKCINLLKHNKTLTMDTISSDEIDLELPDKSKSSEEIVLDNEVKDILSGMIAKLPVEQRVTIFMYYYQDYSIKEIAQFYGCSENTVKSRLNYAKKAMRTEAERLENKGIKLRVVAALPFLYLLFAGERKVFACEIPDCAATISQVMTGSAAAGTSAGSSAVTSTAATSAAAVKTGFFSTLGGKIAIIATAAVVVTGGIAAAIAIPKVMSDKDNTANESTAENNKNDSNDTTTEYAEGTTSSDGTPKPSKPAFDVVDLDLYNELKDSQYVSVILHNPESKVIISQKTEGTKPVVLVYDMEASMKDTFASPFDTYTTINSIGYRFTIANDKYAIYDGSSSTVFDDGYTHIAEFEIKENKSGEKYLSWIPTPESDDNALLNYFGLYEKEKDYDYTAKGSSVQLISNSDNSWYSSILLSDGEIMPDTYVEDIYIRVAENEDYNYYFNASLETPILYDENITETIDSQLQTLTLGDIRILDSIEDLDSVSAAYGEQSDVSLSDTVFYQDILASKISENFGLNIKDKMEFYRTDTLYIRYMHTGNEDGVQIDFAYEVKDYPYSSFSDYSSGSKFEYEDSDGNKFSYFSSTSGIYVYKNEEFTHAKIVLEKMDDEMKWYEALGQSFGIRE